MSKEYPHWIVRLVAERPSVVVMNSDDMEPYEWDSLLPRLTERLPGTTFIAAPGGNVQTLSKEEATAVLEKLAQA